MIPIHSEWVTIDKKNGYYLSLLYNEETDKIGVQQIYYRKHKLKRLNYVEISVGELCDSLISLKDIRKKHGTRIHRSRSK